MIHGPRIIYMMSKLLFFDKFDNAVTHIQMNIHFKCKINRDNQL